MKVLHKDWPIKVALQEPKDSEEAVEVALMPERAEAYISDTTDE